MDVTDRLDRLEPLLRQVAGPTPLELNTGPGGLVVSIDPTELDQVVLNLVTNAAEAAGPTGRVTLRLGRRRVTSVLEERRAPLPPKSPGVYVTIEVGDDGPGVSAGEIPLIFEPFYSSRQLGTASGLGLAIVEEIVRERGGFISVCSEPGQGALFRVGLPWSGGRPSAHSGPYRQPLLRTERAATVLLVDDEPGVLGALGDGLRAAGHDTLVADRGEAAVQLLDGAERSPELLITDIVMPGMDGFELADIARGRWPGLPVLFITGYGEEILARRDLDASKVDILQKPFRMAELLPRVEELLERRANEEAT